MNNTDNVESKSTDSTVMFLGKRTKGITGSTIKIIAILSMLIDHTAAILIEPFVYSNGLYWLNYYMRAIGRIAFPLFCFLLIQGFLYTKSRTKYMLRLGLFAILAEVPFDLAFGESLWDTSNQNVFVTLFLGFAVITCIDWIRREWKWNRYVQLFPEIIVCIIGGLLAELLKTDYSSIGILTIVIMYMLRAYNKEALFGGCMVQTLFNSFEAYAFLGVVPVALYNGKRGLKLKYIFYIFYPAHLLILCGIRALL